jgi:hypothetical protein
LYARAPGYASARVGISTEEWIEVKLDAGARLAGRVVNAQGGPVAGALVDARGRTRDFGLSLGRAVTGQDGRFEIDGLGSEVRRRIAVVSSGFGMAVVVQPADTADVGDIVLHAPRRVEGRVLGPDDAPVAGVKVTLEREAPDDGATVRTERWTDDLGRVRVGGIGDGRHQLTAAPGGGKQVSETLTVAADDHSLPIASVTLVSRRAAS